VCEAVDGPMIEEYACKKSQDKLVKWWLQLDCSIIFALANHIWDWLDYYLDIAVDWGCDKEIAKITEVCYILLN